LAVKFLPDGWVKRLKACQVAEGYIQTFGIDYFETSPVARLYSVRVLLSVAKQWPLHELDIKDNLLYGDIQEDV